VRRLVIYCNACLYCHHSAVGDADRWPDETGPESGVYQVRHDWRRRATELERAIASGEPDRRTVEMIVPLCGGNVGMAQDRHRPYPG
jgi:hypothetical protein